MKVNSMEIVISALLENGWAEDEKTFEEMVRIPTTGCPVYGKSGGELATFGGRLRFAKNERKCTVGKRTTYFYDKINPENCKAFSTTKDMDKIIEEINSVQKCDCHPQDPCDCGAENKLKDFLK